MNTGRGRLRWEHWISALLLSLMALIAFLNVLGRYLFHYSLAFTEEITIHLFVWLTVVGTGLAFERGSQLGMTSFFNLFPHPWQRTVQILSAVLSAGLFIAVDLLLIKTIYFELTLFKATSPALGIPVWIYYAGVVLLSPAVFSGVLKGAMKPESAPGPPDLFGETKSASLNGKE